MSLTMRGHLRKLERYGWHQATTLTELGELTARWLKGDIRALPGYFGNRPDPETKSLIPVLAHLNRSGFLTSCSQPGLVGKGYDGQPVSQRAAVDGFADPGTANWLARVSKGAGLVVVTGRAGWRDNRRSCVPVTMCGGRICTTFGTVLSRREIASIYEGCSDEAIAALQAAVQVTVVDPRWGREANLWRTLQRIPAAGAVA